MVLSMPDFALWIEVKNDKAQEVKKYHTALNSKLKLVKTAHLLAEKPALS